MSKQIPAAAFITTGDTPWRHLLVRAKGVLMRWQGLLYPDAAFLPVWLGAGKVDFIAPGQKIDLKKYTYIFTELHAGAGQLRYPAALAAADPGKMVVITGPPEIFRAYADREAVGLARQLLRTAGQVWAYSPETADFADELAGTQVARVIPWSFDYQATRRLGLSRQSAAPAGRIRVLLGVPLRFTGIAANAPHLLEDWVAEALAGMEPAARRRFRFYAMVYTRKDWLAWKQSGFGRRLGVVLVRKKLYPRFLRFLGNCDAVLTLPRFGVLGRIAFLAAALGKPGIFTSNVALHRRLYPHSLVEHAADAHLSVLVRGLLRGLLAEGSLTPFRPDDAAAREIGEAPANALKLRAVLLSAGGP